jgi:hypothetical protein
MPRPSQARSVLALTPEILANSPILSTVAGYRLTFPLGEGPPCPPTAALSSGEDPCAPSVSPPSSTRSTAPTADSATLPSGRRTSATTSSTRGTTPRSTGPADRTWCWSLLAACGGDRADPLEPLVATHRIPNSCRHRGPSTTSAGRVARRRRRLVRRDYESYGYEFRTIGSRLAALGGPFRGSAAGSMPSSLRRQAMLLIGGSGRRTLRLVAEHADGWHAAFLATHRTQPSVAALRRWCKRARSGSHRHRGVGSAGRPRSFSTRRGDVRRDGVHAVHPRFNGPDWT